MERLPGIVMRVIYMMQETSSFNKICPECGKNVLNDAIYCQYCSHRFFDGSMIENQNGLNRKKLIVRLAALLVVVISTVFGLVYYQKQQSKGPVSTVTGETMSARAMQVENKIVSGDALTPLDISNLTLYELRILRNAHFARYGRSYESPGLGSYFKTRPWYKPDPSYNDKQINSVDRANIELIIAEENRIKSSQPVTVTASTSALSTAGAGPLTTDKVQAAVERALDFTRIGGSLTVQGIHEDPQQNTAQADLNFINFQFKGRELDGPVSKDQPLPQKPDTRSPNYWSEMSQYTINPVKLYSFTGRGSATLNKYNDGRWVLKIVRFGGSGIAANIIIQ